MSRNELTEEVFLPNDFAAALASQRPELLAPFNRQLSLKESKAVAHAFGVMIATNEKQGRKIEELREMLRLIRSESESLRKVLIGNIANLRIIEGYTQEEKTEKE